MCLELLLPVNEVWGKIMFLKVSVILSGGGVAYRKGLPTGFCIQRGVCLQREFAYRRRDWAEPPLNAKPEKGAVRILLECCLFYYEEFVQKNISWKSEKEVDKSLWYWLLGVWGVKVVWSYDMILKERIPYSHIQWIELMLNFEESRSEQNVLPSCFYRVLRDVIA